MSELGPDPRVIADRVAELEEQLQAAEQKAEARETLAQKGNAWRHELQDAHREIAGLKEQLETAQRDARDFYNVSCGYEQQIKDLKEQLETLTMRLNQAHERLTELGVPTHDDAGGPIHSVALRISVLADSIPASEPGAS